MPIEKLAGLKKTARITTAALLTACLTTVAWTLFFSAKALGLIPTSDDALVVAQATVPHLEKIDSSLLEGDLQRLKEKQERPELRVDEISAPFGFEPGQAPLTDSNGPETVQ